MRPLPIALLLLGCAGLGFGWWGTYTVAGHRAYDEMDGIYPAVAGLFGGLLVGLSILVSVIGWWRGRARV